MVNEDYLVFIKKHKGYGVLEECSLEDRYAELTLGSKGQDVPDMKPRFLELGYFHTASFYDHFTDSTADTVRLFEKNYGLPVDGVADAVMLSVLFSDGAVRK